ncbi:SPOR domain-containing protein [Ramlibacter sp. WS9]|uniref:SPOR domain-containing protein n=1 Tax=Ramlibacter sp. WS9 TaxID=1882741 RepID=UPI001142F832|nr:SPOR domain-containing protein [Ramlibacter sp. WS9]ROZ79158.1 SPOR domain-containing protein [Ramlibacter sp. WS9]
MMRLTVLLLLLANAGYFAWSQNLLASWGFAPAQQSEPHRVEQQIKPQAVRVLSADESRRIDVSSGALRPQECLQAAPLDDGQATTLKAALESWPSGSWSLEPTVEPARWILYMGKYQTPENVARKRAELRQLGISFEALANATLEPGLSLGGFATEAEATRQLESLAQRGVRTAKVVQERAEVRGQLLKLAAVDDTLRPRLDELKAGLGARTLRPCR